MPVLVIGVGLGITLTLLPWIPEDWLPLFLLPSFMREKAALRLSLLAVASTSPGSGRRFQQKATWSSSTEGSIPWTPRIESFLRS